MRHMSGGFDAEGDWSLHFVRHEGIEFYTVISGESWLSVDGVRDPVRVKRGDCFLLPRGRTFRMASDISLTPLDAVIFSSTAQNGCINWYNGGGQFFSDCGHLALADDHADILLGS
jgi:mannose-6-phosphate isomerase-like protein (cupin superfamily)